MCGSARERSQQYGAAAAGRIRASVAGYAATFDHQAGISWNHITRQAHRYRDVVGDFNADFLVEIEGIAAGAGLDSIDVLALNLRTELLAEAHRHAPPAGRRSDGCSAVAVLPERSSTGDPILGQTWDWLLHTRSTLVVLEVERDDGPNYTTIVEAGLLAKIGVNAAGLAIATNFLITDHDNESQGVPYHVLLRSLYDARTVNDALVTLRQAHRATSANYLLADASGHVVDVESAPGGSEALYEQQPVDGLLTHTNHFHEFHVAGDISQDVSPGSTHRERRLLEQLGLTGVRINVDTVQQALSDHAGTPRSICAHGDESLARPVREVTACAVIIDPAQRTVLLADGNPCTTPWRRLDQIPPSR